jgi:hypothetical protein
MREMTYKIEIILNEIALERVQRQRPVSHGQHKRVVDKPIPDRGNIGPFEKVVDEVSPESVSKSPYFKTSSMKWELPYGENGSV